MASVMKCDICGEIYKERSVKPWIKMQRMFDTGALPPMYYDACPNCSKKIMDFMSILREHGSNYLIQTTSEPAVSQDDWEKLR